MKAGRAEFVDVFKENRALLREVLGADLQLEARGDFNELAFLSSDNIPCSAKFLKLFMKSVGQQLRNVKFDRLACSSIVFIDL